MKIAVMLVFLVVGQSLAATSLKTDSVQITSVNNFQKSPSKGYKLCNTCIQLAGQFINEALNLILSGGVVGGCNTLCEKLADATTKDIEVPCDLVCDALGIEEFIKIIEKADLDPIYYCELIDGCLIKDDGDAKITSFTVTPTKVTQGSDFVIDMEFQSTNGTGTGELALEIATADGVPLGQNSILLPEAPGAYGTKYTVSAKPDPNCDPTQGPCEMWIAGNYTAKIAVCNGECGSGHPHSKIYDTASAGFMVV